MHAPPVDIKPPKQKKKNTAKWNPVLPIHPFTWTIVAPRKSGKTVLINNLLNRLLRNHNSSGKSGDFFDYVVLVSPTAELDPNFDISKVDLVYDKYRDEVVDHVIEVSDKAGGKANILLILDDIIGLINHSKSEIANFITRSRHYNVSTIITTQVFKGLSPVIRENTSAYSIFKIPNEGELAKLADEIANFEHYYSEAVLKGPPYSFLYIRVEGGMLEYYRNFDTYLGHV